MPLTATHPLGDDEFAALMAPFAPFGRRRRVVVGVSGGADSTALALLLRRWGEPLAVVVDHGLRQESALEAALTAGRMRDRGIPARVVRLGLHPGPDVGARARAARYAALLDACRCEGRPDLLLGHHARDQVETVALRARAGSGEAGLAGMAAVAWRDDGRLVRPLLQVAPERLRVTCLAAGVPWIEDPTNKDPATARGALRLGLHPAMAVPLGSGVRRRAAEQLIAAELASGVTLHPGGFATVGILSPSAWSALLWTLSGRAYPPAPRAVEHLAAAGRGTLHGFRVRDGWVFREEGAMSGPVPAVAGARWDRRFVMAHGVQGGEIGALGGDATLFRCRPGPPIAVLRTLPALRIMGKLHAVPHMTYPDNETCRTLASLFRPARPLAGAAFAPADGEGGGCT